MTDKLPAANLLAPPIAPAEATFPCVLGIDVGTSSARALLYDAEARPIDALGRHVLYNPVTSHDGGAVFDADELFALTLEILDGVVAAASGVGPIAGVGISCFWHSLLGLDEMGAPRTPVYLWADTRARRAVPRLRLLLDVERAHATTGAVAHSSYWPAKLLWLAESDPELYRGVRYWVSFAEYVYLRLFGRRQVSVSMASGTGLLDVHTCRWDELLLNRLPVAVDQLSTVDDDPLVQLSSAYADRWPALSGVAWFPAYGDGACSNIGVGGVSPRRAVVTVGTSGAMRVVLTGSATRIPSGLWAYRVDGQRYVLGGALSEGGNLMAWLESTLRIPSLDKIEDEIARRSADAGRLVVLPFIAGERSPHWSPDARAVIAGIDLHTTPVDIVQACLESVAYQFHEIYRLLSAALPAPEIVIATGGALLRSPTWIQILANVLDRPVVASRVGESSSRGAAILALEALGLVSESQIQPYLGTTYNPLPGSTASYRDAMTRQQQLYQAVIAPHLE